jgi:hypothetical protein
MPPTIHTLLIDLSVHYSVIHIFMQLITHQQFILRKCTRYKPKITKDELRNIFFQVSINGI